MIVLRQAELLHRPRLVLVAGQRDSRGRRRRAAGPHRAAAPAARRRGPVRPAAQAAAAVPARHHRADHRAAPAPPSTTSTTVAAAALARGAVRGPQHRRAGPQRRAADRRGAARTRRRPGRRRHRVARGGGSVEDLLPFSDETLCRAIAACTTPVVSAVGHEPDNPLCDLVADLRAATPTDAAKRIVPDTAAELALVARSAPAQRAGAAQLGAPRAAARWRSCAAGRCWPSRCARADAARPTRSTAPAPPSAATSPGWWPPNPTGSATCRRGWPRWDRRRPWRAATRWCRPVAAGDADGAAHGGRRAGRDAAADPGVRRRGHAASTARGAHEH